jgi:hypothetical protein
MGEQHRPRGLSPRVAKPGVWVTVGANGVSSVSIEPRAIRASCREATAHGYSAQEALLKAIKAWQREKARVAR